MISFWKIAFQNFMVKFFCQKKLFMFSQKNALFHFSGQPWPQLALLQLDGSTLAGWHRGHPHHHHCLSYPGSVFKVILKQSQNRDMLQSCCDPQHFTCQVVYTLYCVMVDSKRAGWWSFHHRLYLVPQTWDWLSFNCFQAILTVNKPQLRLPWIHCKDFFNVISPLFQTPQSW